ncbi:amino acid adenylation domain-containing protein [Alteromonadaceae bacterium 2753L.S.0a.02]|nr:amino acid adenylation domain-containing protein [Alteromonadaceae bacterium 2753L.S.0a.02]
MADELDSAIAVVSMGVRVPGASTIEELWQLFFESECAQKNISCMNGESIRHEKNWVKCRGILQNVADFDSNLFGITPKEAALIDPQQRIFLELAWGALYGAGLLAESQKSHTGLWVAAASSDYLVNNLMQRQDLLGEGVFLQSVIGNGSDYLAARVAHKASLTGPVVTLAGDESGSAVAVALAYSALLQGECDIALAGGISIATPQEDSCFHQQPPASDWHLRHHPYDGNAQGSTLGHGGGVIVLKRLQDAIAGGDHIHAVIRSAAIANAGSKATPDPEAGALAVNMAIAMADITPGWVDYIEGSGTAFPGQDDKELETLGHCYKERNTPLIIGSHSANTGYLTVASGVLGVIKNALILQHRLTPAMPGHVTNSAAVSKYGFEINTESVPWRASGRRRVVALNSFGASGNHVHLIMEEAPPFVASRDERNAYLWRFSAASKHSVCEQVKNMAQYLKAQTHHTAGDIEYSLEQSNLSQRYRVAVACENVANGTEILETVSLANVIDAEPAKGSSSNVGVVFLFPGQGSQLPGMAQRLYDTQPVFADIIDTCAETLLPLLQKDIRSLVFEEAKANPDILNETSVTQPVLFAFETALASLWLHWGVKPAAMMGHSLGEYVAACLAGLFDLKTGCMLVFHRGRLMQAQPRGAMLAVRDSAEVVAPYIAETQVVVAGYNAPEITVVAGDYDAIDNLQQALDAHEIKYKRLATSHAFHSPLMAGALPEFKSILSGVSFRKPQDKWISCVTGNWVDEAEVTTADYWLQQLASPVRFAEGVTTVCNELGACFLEVGPGRALSSLVAQQVERPNADLPLITSLAYEPDSDLLALSNALGQLWSAGLSNTSSIWKDLPPGKKIPLPGYAFDRSACWVSPTVDNEKSTATVVPPAQLATEQNVAEQLGTILCDVSGFTRETLAWEKGFLEQGFDSLLLTQVANRTARTFKLTCKMRDLLERLNSPYALERYIEKARTQVENRLQNSQPAFSPLPKTSQIEWQNLTAAQREIAAVVQMGDSGSAAYNQCLVLDLKGDIKLSILSEAILVLFNRHDALRTRFNKSYDQQKYVQASQLTINDIDLSGRSSAEARATASHLAEEQVSLPFDLIKGPLVRATLIQMPENSLKLILASHHIVYDGWSSRLFFQELAHIYSHRCKNAEIELSPSVSFAEHVAFEQELQVSDTWEDSVEYWKAQFTTLPEPLGLPTDRPRPPLKTYHSARVDFVVNISSKHLARAAAKNGATPVAFLLTAFQLLLSRISRQQDIVVGLPISVRDPDVANFQMGHATNLLPMRLNFDNENSFSDLLERNRLALLDAQDHKMLTFGSLLSHLQLDWSPDRTPLVTTMFNLDRGRQCPTFEGCEAKLSMPERKFANFELELQVVDLNDRFQLEATYNSDLFNAASVAEWLESFDVMLHHLITNSDAKICEIPIVSERQKLKLNRWNATEFDYPASTRLEVLISEQCLKTPNKIAISCLGESLSYQQLLDRARIINGQLLARGVHQGDFIGVCLQRSPDMLATIIAILQCGAAFVPLDPSFPTERLAYIVENSELVLVVSNQDLAARHGCDRDKTFNLEDIGRNEQNPSPLQITPDSDCRMSIAYVLYTSGSTGKPKGVCISHQAIVNFLFSMAFEPGLHADDSLLAVTTLSFDISMLELLLPLLRGARIVLATSEESKDAHQLAKILERESVTVMQATPATWRMLVDSGWQGKQTLKVLCGGEALPLALASQLLERCRELWNMYGPTETTVWSTCKRVLRDTPLTLGAPIKNTTVWVLDDQKQLCPPGVLGEIYIGGDGVALGYHRRPELTQERFVVDPYSLGDDARLYNTGDVGRWLPDGELEYFGRNDFQVKIRGFRIELGEIEKVLQKHASVHDAVVHTHPAPSGEAQLIAYVIPEHGQSLDLGVLETYMHKQLTSYMVPRFYVTMEHFPLTPNAKVDRKALPPPKYPELTHGTTYARPKNDIEVKISELFANRLGLKNVDPNEDFFRLGGNSILAVALVNDLNNSFDLSLPVGQIFQHPTIAGLSTVVEQGGGVLKSMVVALTQYHNKPTIYFVCGIALYHTLAVNLGEEYSCYGVFVPEEEAFLQGDSQSVTIEDLAKLYIRAIREHQPEGRIALAGVSFGGLLAFEMARQLGTDVSALTILDCILPKSYQRDWWLTLKRNLNRKTLQRILGSSANTKVHTNTARSARNNRNLQLWNALRGKGTLEYLNSLPTCTIPTLLIKAEIRPGLEHFKFLSDLGWKKYAVSDLRVDSVAGDHLGILESKITAKKIIEFLITV